MNKALTLIFVFFLLVPLAFAEPPFQETTQKGTLIIQPAALEFIEQNSDIHPHWHVFNSSGFAVTNETTDCIVHVYNQTLEHLLEANGTGDSNGVDFKINENINTSKTGIYYYIIQCNNTVEAGYTAGGFEITTDGRPEDPQPTVALTLILLPIFLAFMLLIGATSLGKDHTPLKIFLFLASIPTYFISSNFATDYIYKYERFPELINDIAFTTTVVGWVYFAIIAYFMIYITILIFQSLQKKKQENLRY